MPKLTDQTELTSLADGDLVHTVDISDTTSSPQGTSKKITITNFFARLLSRVNTFTKTNSITPVSLTSSGASIAVDGALSNLFKHTLTENTTLATPSNLVEGTTYLFYFKQHASSAKTLAFSSAYLFVGGTDPVIAATAGALLIISATYIDGVLVCVFNQNFA